MKKIKKRFMESSFFRVFSIVKKNPNIYLYTIILDFIFLTFIIFIGKYVGSLIPQDTQQLMDLFKTQTNLMLFVFIYPVIYYLIVVLIYSITKLSILNLIKQLYGKSKFTLRGLGRFYLLNILLFIIFFLTALIIMGILALVLRRDILAYLVLVLAVPFLFFFYSVLNISHTLSVKNERSKLIKNSFIIAFNKIPKYGAFIIWDIVLVSVYLLFYNSIHLIFRLLFFTSAERIAAYGSIYLKILNIIFIIFIYLVIAFNRIYFCNRIDKNAL